jgi:hypothetical protein
MQQPAQAGNRQPLTSLHADLGRFGVPPQAATEQQPGQQPLPRPQQRGGGIEF